MTTTMEKKEYMTPAIEIVEFDAKESMMISASNSTFDGEELSNKRRPNTIWGTSDGISSMGNSSK